jgi:2-polyprenyl-3-methyl-5-hydroxy-6-metoxy-1,4-benzoquinol methylase
VNLDNFYSSSSISAWKTVLGEDMHYHHGTPGDNPFEQAVLDVMAFIPPESKVLDCGCGWGGPGRLLQKHGHKVTGVTSSKQQAEYITEFPVVHADLHDYKPSEPFDAAIFIESCFHLEDPEKVFDNLIPNVKHIVILDITTPKIIQNEVWGITFRPKEYLLGALHKVGYVVEHQSERTDFIKPALKFWGENIKTLDRSEVVGQIKELELLCQYPDEVIKVMGDPRQILVHAKRR